MPRKTAALKSAAKTSSWTVPTVLGLAVSVIGAMGLIELRSQLSVTAQAQLVIGQPFSSPFELTNTGYLKVHVENVVLVVHKAEYAGGKVIIRNTQNTNVGWDNFDLESGDSKTLLAYFSNGQPDNADRVFAVDYRFLGRTSRRLFRFVGIHMDIWQWSKQPLGDDLRPEITRSVDQTLTLIQKFSSDTVNPKSGTRP